MKLHDLRPADGSRQPRMRVGRGIAAGKGKTAGRGTKGQKARAGGGIPPWFEGGQTPLHMRIPKLRGFKNRFKIVYEVVNIGAIGTLAERGAFEGGEPAGLKAKSGVAAPATVNQDILRAVGLVRTLNKPLKILGTGELSTPLFVVADAFTKSAVAKIEAAGGTISILEIPTAARPAIGLDDAAADRTAREPRTAAGRAAAGKKVEARATRAADAAEAVAEAAAVETAKAAKPPKAPRASRAEPASDDAEVPATEVADAAADERSTGDADIDADNGDA
ncbi:MAG: large subunit ribosomal protein [Chloroflexota bacterium]|jgi:large subunit ribosomal protein L15|nr:large subunit ribosomal protein [Chloroflexota bacterium]